MADELSAAAFKRCLNANFKISTLDQGDESLEAELIEVRGLNSDTGREDRTPFSLLFRGPTDIGLEQQTFRVENETMGEMAIFLVTLGPDPDDAEKRMLYEAVFT